MGKSIHEYAMSNTQKLHRWSLLNIARYYRAGEILPDPHIQNIIQCDTQRGIFMAGWQQKNPGSQPLAADC